MNCLATRRLLDSFVDGELAPSQMAVLREHLDRCPCCSQEYQALRLLKKDLARLPRCEADAEFENRLASAVMAEIGRRPERARRWIRLAACAGFVAAIAAAAGLQALEGRKDRAQAAAQREFELHRDQAYSAGEDPLAGGSFMLPASYGR